MWDRSLPWWEFVLRGVIALFDAGTKTRQTPIAPI